MKHTSEKMRAADVAAFAGAAACSARTHAGRDCSDTEGAVALAVPDLSVHIAFDCIDTY